ncbi:hypothetical protein [Deinococcus koreensis]|uniref:Uncharacterized protein n=1 Tax=Deinococcus koreensis TaxID=2054903 RepID=A0A2K3UXW6_9DEIO|nr:hypothetical protein [Deinococcus koreensis]PNY81383.1 hypothetical protein CVO96_08295 [Deinococcus koreensis]
MRVRVLPLLLSLPLLCPGAQARGGGGAPPFAAPPPVVRPGQVWTLDATTAQGERFQTALQVGRAAPTGTPATYRADRGVLILDAPRGSLVALDLQDARAGGLGLACVVTGSLGAPVLEGVLAVGPLGELPARLEQALAVVGVARTPAERAEASRELGLGTCRLTLGR